MDYGWRRTRTVDSGREVPKSPHFLRASFKP
uniref:Uncharacterized protein n=1 Tax=Arundo donax TaxID=35708 RepID=A0A0A9GYN9_ARUDO